MALLEIKCPMCKGTIWIEPSTGKVVDHKPADSKSKMDLKNFMQEEKNKLSKMEMMFKKAEEEKKKRKAEMEDFFKDIKNKKEELLKEKDDMDSPLDWD